MPNENVIRVEGPEDWNVFLHLIKQHFTEEQVTLTLKGGVRPSSVRVSKAAPQITFQVMHGVDFIRTKTLSAQLKSSELKCLGIVLDADASMNARWQSLRDILRQLGYSSAPEKPDATGTIIEQSDQPRVGVWLMPNNELPGKLEDFIRFLVPQSDVLWPVAERCVDQIPKADRKFTDVELIKAYIHTWLAWQEVPGIPMGQAISAKFLDPYAPHAVQLIAWVQRLFDLA